MTFIWSETEAVITFLYLTNFSVENYSILFFIY